MSVKTKILAGVAGLVAAAGVAAPAAAQYYPGNPGYGYNNNGGGILGAIVNQVLGYGRYPYGNYGYNNNNGAYGYQYQQTAVQQCARAVEARLNGNGYGNGAYGNPYNNGYNGQYGGYNNGYGNNGQYGGYGYNNQYGYNNGYNGYANGGARVVGISRVDRKSYGFRVYGVATDRFGNGAGYNNGYGQPTIKFDCKVEANGYIRDMNVDRDMADYRYGRGW